MSRLLTRLVTLVVLLQISYSGVWNFPKSSCFSQVAVSRISFSEEALAAASEFDGTRRLVGTPYLGTQLKVFELTVQEKNPVVRPTQRIPVFRLPLANRPVKFTAEERLLLLRYRALSPVEEGTLFVRRLTPLERKGVQKIAWVSLETDWRPDFSETSVTVMTEITSGLFVVVIPGSVSHMADDYQFNFDVLKADAMIPDQVDPIYEVVKNGDYLNEIGKIGRDTPYFYRDDAVRDLQGLTITPAARNLIDRIWFYHLDADWEIFHKWLWQVPLLDLDWEQAIASFGKEGAHLMLETIDHLAPKSLERVRFRRPGHERKMLRERKVLGVSGAKIEFAARYLRWLDVAGLIENSSVEWRRNVAGGLSKLSSLTHLHWAATEKGMHLFWQEMKNGWIIFLIDALRQPGAGNFPVVDAEALKRWILGKGDAALSLTDVFGNVPLRQPFIPVGTKGIRLLLASQAA